LLNSNFPVGSTKYEDDEDREGTVFAFRELTAILFPQPLLPQSIKDFSGRRENVRLFQVEMVLEQSKGRGLGSSEHLGKGVGALSRTLCG
jgi:hypothetical protein